MNRREFIAISAGASVAAALPAAGREGNAALPIIDTHIHLFDTNRPQGVPWPGKNDHILYKPALPERYRGITGNLGIVGAIVVEASPWLDDNQWVLDIAGKDPVIVGVIGNLEPGKPEFAKQVGRFKNNPLFRGIRYGNLWGHDLSAQLNSPAFVSDLKALADNGLVLDTANPNPVLLDAVVRLTDKVPDLKVVIDHLPQMAFPADNKVQRASDASLREIGQRPKIYVKISEVFRKVDGRIPTELNFYSERLDKLFMLFGEDRLLYGSDWPNSDHWLPVSDGLDLVRAYFTGKGQTASEKYFWRNSVAAYNWQKRDAKQPWR